MAIFEEGNNSDHSYGDMWPSASDLFMMLSTIFLLLYVVATLRNGTASTHSKQEHQRLEAELTDLREQNRVYDTLKDNYLDTSGNKQEQDVYKELINKLSLLQDEAKKEKNALRAQARENEKKETALNQYQQIVRNIINANVLAKAGLKNRDVVIQDTTKALDQTKSTLDQTKTTLDQTRVRLTETEKTVVVKEGQIAQNEKVITETQSLLRKRRDEVANLSQAVRERENQIRSNENRIHDINSNLKDKIDALNQARTRDKMTKKAHEQQVAQLRSDSAKRIDALAAENSAVNNGLTSTRASLAQASTALSTTRNQLEAKNAENEALAGDLQRAGEQHQQAIAKAKADFGNQIAADRKAFDDGLAKMKLSAAQRAGQEKAFRDQTAKKEAELQGKLASLNNRVADSQGKLQQAQMDAKKYQDYVNALKKEREGLARDLEASQNALSAKKRVAKDFNDAFRRANLRAEVDEKNGDVTVSFGDEYFETNQADLKNGMRAVLGKLIPVYADTLLNDAKLSKLVDSVEIVGFSSPTYQNRLVDPQSLAAKDRQAINYNLDLSYRRARSIFNYIFDTDKLRYKNQQQLLKLVKVSGRSFLAEEVKGRDLTSGLTHAEFCQKYDCRKAQKVIIRFNLKE